MTVRLPREASVEGTIDAVATDHAPHTAERKQQPWCAAPFGMTGVETALPVVAHVLSELDMLDWRRVTELMSEPARIGGLISTKNAPLEVGGPATFWLVEPHAYDQVVTSDHHSKSSNSPFRDLWLPTRSSRRSSKGRSRMANCEPAGCPRRPRIEPSTDLTVGGT